MNIPRYDPDQSYMADERALCADPELAAANKRDPFLQFLDLEHEEMTQKKIMKPKKNKKCFFLTIQDFKRTLSDFEDMVKFMKNSRYLFTDLLYVIESGKNEDDPHLHVHLLGNYVNPKKGKSKVCLEYKKIFNSNLNEKDYWDLRQWNKSKEMPPYSQWLEEKVDYILDNNKKGTHANFVDLSTRPGGRGAGGVLTSFI